MGKIFGAKELKAGMTIRVHERIKDISAKGEERERIQIFEGVIMGLRGGAISKTMTVRRVSKGYGVEKIYPLETPSVTKIEVIKIAKVRRAKLSFLRNITKPFKRKFKETIIKK
jgi:large subunit ribosomal protein L19